MPENTALENEEEDIIQMFAVKSEDEDNEVDEFDEVDSEDELPESADELKAMLLRERDIKSKRNKSLKKSKQANHRMQEELQSFRTRMDELERKPTAPANTDAEKQERQKALDEWRDSVADDPTKAVDFSNWQMEQMQDKVVEYISGMQSKFDQQIAELKGATNPEKLKYESELSAMRTNSAFANLDDDTLIGVIKGLKSKQKKSPRGGIGGQRATASTEEFKLTDDIKSAMGFNN